MRARGVETMCSTDGTAQRLFGTHVHERASAGSVTMRAPMGAMAATKTASIIRHAEGLPSGRWCRLTHRRELPERGDQHDVSAGVGAEPGREGLNRRNCLLELHGRHCRGGLARLRRQPLRVVAPHQDSRYRT